MTWWEYVQRHSQDCTTQMQIAARFGVDQTRVSGWARKGEIPAPETAIKIARHLGRAPAEVLLAAGHITADEARAEVVHVRLDEPDDDQLIRMISERLRKAGEDDAHQSATTKQAGGSPAVGFREVEAEDLTGRPAEPGRSRGRRPPGKRPG